MGVGDGGGVGDADSAGVDVAVGIGVDVGLTKGRGIGRGSEHEVTTKAKPTTRGSTPLAIATNSAPDRLRFLIRLSTGLL